MKPNFAGTMQDAPEPTPAGYASWDAFIEAAWLDMERAAAQGDELAAYYRDRIADLVSKVDRARATAQARGRTDD